MSFSTTAKFIAKAVKVHGDKYDYSKANYLDYRTKVEIVCKEHGSFFREPQSHFRGYGCPTCARNKLRLTLDTFIRRANAAHNHKYDYSQVEYKNANCKVCIICKEHGPFFQEPHNHLQGRGCPKCGTDRTRKQRRKSIDAFLLIAKQAHGDKYDYSKVDYLNYQTKVEIVCKEHGSFWQRPANHAYNKRGCPKCSRNRVKSTTNIFIQKANIVHHNKYNYSNVEYKNADHNVCVVCKIHGPFFQSPHSHLQGHGCPKCKDDVVKKRHQKSIDDFLSGAKRVHGNRYDYSRVDYQNCEKKVKIICRLHGEFLQTPSVHINTKCGCPKCNLSRGEGEISSWLDNNNIDYIHQSKFPDCRNPKTNYPLRFDFYIPSKNILIEYDGPQHSIVDARLTKYIFTQKDLDGIKYRDGLKSAYASAKGIKLLRINYLGKKNIREVLRKELL